MRLLTWPKSGPAIIALAMIASGCANQIPGLPDFLQDIRSGNAYKKADELVLDGQYIAAADHLWQVAPKLPPQQQQQMQIRAVNLLLDANLSLEAYGYLVKIPEEQLTSPLLLEKRTAEARFYRHTHQSEKIIALLPLELIEQGDTRAKITALRLAADARISNDTFVEGIELYLVLHKLLDKKQRRKNITVLANTLLYLSPERIKEELANNPSATTRPWLELATLATPSQIDFEALEQQYAIWQKTNKDWELPDSFIEKLRARWKYLDYQPQKVALLLPLTGPYAKIGKAVKNGFLESYQAASTPRFSFAFHNTDQSTDIRTVYKKSTADKEVDLVIGPLLKPEVDALIQSGVVDVLTITLNYATSRITPPQNNLFQFGLSPEDEVLQAAQKIWNDGHKFIAVLAPDDSWGERLYGFFEREYTSLGGTIRAISRYDPGFVDYGTAIKSLFQIDQSMERHRLISNALGNEPRFTPRIRDDISASMLFADPQRAVMIFPQMKFYYADKLPAYATSHVYNPKTMTGERDLDGLVYCDIPAIIYWENFSGTKPEEFTRLHALGSDVEKLIKHFRRMRLAHFPLDGQTGRISIEKDRHLFRKLPWARFQHGKPIPLYAL